MTDEEVKYEKIDEVAPDGIRLFKVMMRLEFALKEIGCGRSTNGGGVEVCWDGYANKRLGPKFWERIKLEQKAKTLIENPPKKQVLKEKNLEWEEAGPVRSVQDLLGALRRVRNNLFHGGKSGDPDVDRNAQLYAAALYVIDQILREDEDLRASFTGYY